MFKHRYRRWKFNISNSHSIHTFFFFRFVYVFLMFLNCFVLVFLVVFSLHGVEVVFYLCIGRFGMGFGRVLSVVRTLPTKTAHPRFTPHYQCVNWFKLCDWKMLGFEWFIFHRDRLLVSWNVALASLLFYKALVFYSNAQRLAFMLGWSVLWCWGNLVMQIRYILFFITQKITALSPWFFPVLCLQLECGRVQCSRMFLA